MQYTWDPEKDAVNRRKHGLSLAVGIDALEDPYRDSWIDDRFDYGEERIVTLGLSKEGILYVVSTDWGENWTRIISVRGAENDEIEQYDLGRA
ncbi:MAG: BrnT family toxin [Terracidiphilus sp.]